MELNIIDLNQKTAGKVTVNKELFSVEPRQDVLARVVNWQLAKRRAGTHKTKGISEISGTTKKPFKQKGTGSARAGSLRAPQMRGGATIFGPVVRSHEYSLNKKVRKLGLRMAVSGRVQENKLFVLKNDSKGLEKTSAVAKQLAKFDARKVLFIADGEFKDQLLKVVRNIPNVNVLPSEGLNVYSIMNHDTLIVAQDSVEQVEARLA